MKTLLQNRSTIGVYTIKFNSQICQRQKVKILGPTISSQPILYYFTSYTDSTLTMYHLTYHHIDILILV